MEIRVNRAEVLFENWRELENSLKGFAALNGSSSREMLVQQHAILSRGLARIGREVRPYERPHVDLLQASVKRMARRIWPNPLVRFLVRLKAEFFEKPRMLKQFRAMKEENQSELKRFMAERGFGALTAGLERSLDYERQRVELSMSAELHGGRRIGLDLELAQDPSGRYLPSLIGASLVESDGSKKIHHFLADQPLDAAMLVNLMQGRAVSVVEKDGLGGENGKWLQVDFGREPSQLRNFNADYGFDVAGRLRELSAQFGMAGLNDQRLLEDLKKGKQVSFVAPAPFEGKISFEADPSSRQLTLRGEAGQVLSLAELMERKRSAQLEMDLQAAAVRKIEVRPERASGQEKGMGM